MTVSEGGSFWSIGFGLSSGAHDESANTETIRENLNNSLFGMIINMFLVPALGPDKKSTV